MSNVGKIAKTVFSTGPSDQVATVDVYKNAPNEVVNANPNKADSELGKSLKSQENKLFGKGGLTDSLKKLGSDGKIDAKDILAGGKLIRQAATELKDNLTKFTSDNLAGIKSEVVERLLSANGISGSVINLVNSQLDLPGTGKYSDNNEFKILIDNITHIRESTDLSSVRGIFDAFSQLTASEGPLHLLVDKAELTLLKGIQDELTQWRIPELTDRLINHFKDDKLKRAALLQMVEAASLTSDLYTISKAIGECGNSAILAKYPELIETILSNYRLPNEDQDNLEFHQHSLLALLTALDANWMYYTNTKSIHLKRFNSLSADARTLLSYHPDFNVACLLGPMYGSSDYDGLAQTAYPLSGIGNSAA